MKKKTLLSLLIALAMVFMLAACGGTGGQGGADDGQNPAMNFIGNYNCDRANIMIGCEGQEGMVATVTWGSSVSENTTWTMSGTFDADALVFEYHDCVRTEYLYEEDGEVKSMEDVYVGGHGFMTFSEDGGLTLTWQDDQDHIADGLVFEYTGTVPE